MTMNVMTPLAATPDYAAIKAKQSATWASGDYAKIGTTLQIVGEILAEAMNLAPGAKVLDVAAGNGNATLAFARRWSQVTSTDYVASMLDKGKARAQAEALSVTFSVADAENLPFAANGFDAVVSTFGVMFAPNQAAAASELLRVCRPGGKIGLANWTPEGFIGQLFRTLGMHVPPPAGLHSPARWGDKQWLQQTFGPNASAIEVEKRNFVFRYHSVEHFVDFFRTYYGPVHKAFLALGPERQMALGADIGETVRRFETSMDGSLRVPSEYAEVIITKR
jgi:ubiquinone/menaquinone biosynthesis C-methylase UbiE